MNFILDTGKFADNATLTHTIAEHLPAIVFVLEIGSKKVKYVNERFADVLGLTQSQVNVMEDVFSECIRPDLLDDFRGQITLFSNDVDLDRWTLFTEFKTASGKYHRFRLEGSVIYRSPSGIASTVLFTATDIEEFRKLFEESGNMKELLHETEEMLEYGTWTLDIATGYMKLTPGLIKLLGYAPEDLPESISREFYLDHLINGYQEGLREILEQAILMHHDFEYEYLIQTRSGSRKTFLTKGKLVKNGNTVEKVIGITRDISTLRNFEKEQDKHIRDLNRSNKELEEFAYIASHDLQEPLRKISMFSERLRQKGFHGIDKESELFLERIMAASSSMKNLIDNLLEFSRANRSSHNFATIDLKAIIDQTLGDLELKIEETKSRITVLGSIPKMEGVATELKQLFGNLISNAIKFRKADQPAEITLHSRKLSKDEKASYHLTPQRTYYKIEIADQGIGFEEEYTEKIFQVFQRLHGKAEYPGSGIGLAICKKIVENHNGLIFAHGVPGEGAVFTVILPEKQF